MFTYVKVNPLQQKVNGYKSGILNNWNVNVITNTDGV